MAEPLLKQHQLLARGEPLPSGNFEVAALSSHSAGGPKGGKSDGMLKDHQRGAAPPIGGNQANPDHGEY